MLPAISSKLLVAQTAVADAAQPGLAPFDGMCGVATPNPGIAAVNVEKLGLLTTSHNVNWAAGVLQGEVTIEIADELSYTGPWVPIAVVNFVAGVTSIAPNTAVKNVSGSAGQPAPRQDVVIIEGAYGAYRHRITQPVVGGSVTTKIVGTT